MLILMNDRIVKKTSLRISRITQSLWPKIRKKTAFQYIILTAFFDDPETPSMEQDAEDAEDAEELADCETS